MINDNTIKKFDNKKVITTYRYDGVCKCNIRLLVYSYFYIT